VAFLGETFETCLEQLDLHFTLDILKPHAAHYVCAVSMLTHDKHYDHGNVM